MSRAKNPGQVWSKYRRAGATPNLAEIAAQLPGCLLCDGVVDVVGIFLPEHPHLWPGPPQVPGKLRVLFYGLCNRCMDIPEPESMPRVLVLMKAGAPC